MKLLNYIIAGILMVQPVLASSSEDSEEMSPETTRRTEAEIAQKISTLDGLEAHLIDLKIECEPFTNRILQAYGCQPVVLAEDHGISAEDRFLAASGSPALGLGVKAKLTYNDLLSLRQNRGMRTKPTVFLTFCSRNPDEVDHIYPLSDCRMLNDLTDDMSAYCICLPRTLFEDSGSASVLGELRSGSADALTARVIEQSAMKKATSLNDIQLTSGREQDEVFVQSVSYSCLSSIMYRLYKAGQPVGVFSLMTFKIEGGDRAAIIKQKLPWLQTKIAKWIRKADEDKIPDFKQYEGQ